MAKIKSKKKKRSSTYKVLSFIFFILTFAFVFLLFNLNVLPSRYMLIVCMSLIVVNFILYLLLKFTDIKIIKLFTIIVCLCLTYGVISLVNTNDVLNSMNKNYKVNTYEVIVLNDSNYKGLKDLKYKTIGYFEDEKDILKNLKITFESKPCQDLDNMVNNLFDKEVEAIVLEKSYVDMLSEDTSTIPDFKSKTKIIYTFDITTKISNITKDIDTTKNSFCIYISGIDTYGSIDSSSRSDANMLVVVNPKSKQILMISIPRDYYVDLYNKNGKDKLTHSGIYGIDTTVKTIENLIDIDINYYYKINFTSLIEIVDSLDGVDVYSKYTFTSKDGYNYKKGYNHVDGKEALSFVRERKSFAAGDKVRNINQQALVEALFRKITNKNVLVKYNSILKSLKGSFVTNMPSNRVTTLIKQQLDSNSKWNITSYALDGTSSREYTYSYKSTSLYVMLPDVESIAKAKSLITDTYNGKKLENSYIEEVKNIQTVTKVTNNKKVTSNMPTSNLKSNVNKKAYNVTYIIDDKEYKYVVEEGDIIDNVNIPPKDGYDIIGWYFNDSLYDFSKPVNSDIILVATYSKEESILESEDNVDEESITKEDINIEDIIKEDIE